MPEIGSMVRSQVSWPGILGRENPLLGIKTREGDTLSQIKYEREKRKSYCWQNVHFNSRVDQIQILQDGNQFVNFRLQITE